jgi:DnaJ-domain-containing protein 1
VSHVETRHTFEQDPAEVAQEMRDAASLSDRVEKPVYHLSVSFPVGDDTSQDERLEVMDELLEDLELEDHQALIVEHQDEQHPHVHAMVNRVQHDPQAEGYAKAWTNSNDFQKIERSLRRMEKEREWREVAGYHARPEQAEKPSPAPTSGEIQRYKRTGDLPFGDVVSEVAGHHFEEAESWADLEGRLREHGIWVEAKGRGGVVTDGEETAKLSDVGREYSRYKLEERFDQTHAEFREQRQRRDSRSDEPGSRSSERDGEADSRSSIGAEADPVRTGGDHDHDRPPIEREGGSEDTRRDSGRGRRHSEEGFVGGRKEGEEDEGADGRGRERDPVRDQTGDTGGSQRGGGKHGGEVGPLSGHGESRGGGANEDGMGDELDATGDGGDGDRNPSIGRGRSVYDRGDYREESMGGKPGREEDRGVGEETETGGKDDRKRVRAIPESLRRGGEPRGPELTEVNRLSDRGRDVWEHLTDGENEEAARVFDQLSEESQRALVEKLDSFDRSDLREGCAQAIERDAPDRSQEKGQHRSQSQDRSQGRERGGITR